MAQQFKKIKTIEIRLSLNDHTLLILTSIDLLEAHPHTSWVPPFIGSYMSLSSVFIQLADKLSFLFYHHMTIGIDSLTYKYSFMMLE